ncbi:MAG: hypothetical protein ACKOQ3_05745 [Novosphingobium sp.]
MRRLWLLIVLAASACKPDPTPQQKAASDAAAVAQVEAAQKLRAPVQPLALQTISAADSAAAAISGAGCAFVPAGAKDPVLVGDTERAVIKTSDVTTTMAVDVGASATTHHYIGKTHTAFIDQGSDKGRPWGEEGIRAAAVMTMHDSDRREVYRASGTLYCGA